MDLQIARKRKYSPAITSLDTFVSRANLAKLLDCSPSTVDKWRRQGRGPRATKLPTGSIRYRVGDLVEWVNGSDEELPR